MLNAHTIGPFCGRWTPCRNMRVAANPRCRNGHTKIGSRDNERFISSSAKSTAMLANRTAWEIGDRAAFSKSVTIHRGKVSVAVWIDEAGQRNSLMINAHKARLPGGVRASANNAALHRLTTSRHHRRWFNRSPAACTLVPPGAARPSLPAAQGVNTEV